MRIDFLETKISLTRNIHCQVEIWCQSLSEAPLRMDLSNLFLSLFVFFSIFSNIWEKQLD